MKKVLSTFISLFIVTALFAAQQVVDKTMAVVNGEPVLLSEFNSLFEPIFEQYKKVTLKSSQNIQKENELRDAVLNQQIGELLLKQKVKKDNIRVSKKEIQDRIALIKKNFSNDAEFKAELKKENMTLTSFEKNISDQLAVMKLVRQNIESKIKHPTEAEVKALYDKIIVEMKNGKTNLSPENEFLVDNLAIALKRMSSEQLRLRQIFISCPKNSSAAQVKSTQEKIATIKKELQAKTFSDIAAKYSDDAASKERSGDMGLVTRTDLSSNISKVVFSMNVGSYTKEPIKTDIGYHFIKIEEKRAKRDLSFDDIKGDILELMYQSNFKDAYDSYVNELKSKANIKINKTW